MEGTTLQYKHIKLQFNDYHIIIVKFHKALNPCPPNIEIGSFSSVSALDVLAVCAGGLWTGDRLKGCFDKMPVLLPSLHWYSGCRKC